MMYRGRDYDAALREALDIAGRTGRDMGIEKLTDLDGFTVYAVRHLPNPENRFGVDARCEVVYGAVYPDHPQHENWADHRPSPDTCDLDY